MSGALVVFAKAPEPGRVKTRLSPPLSLPEAAALYGCLLDDVLEESARAAELLGLVPYLAVHPPEACAALARRAPTVFRTLAQRGENLAERMEAAVEDVASRGHEPILLRGSDSPTLEASVLRAALAALEHSDLVLCPDRDGGYNLVALRAPCTRLFDHPMSTDSVLADTLAHAARAGLRADVLPPGFDIDTIGDLHWLADARRVRADLPCPRTLDHLDRHGLWSLAGPVRRGARTRPD